MSDFPFHLPSSLVSYAVQFESSPDKALNRLKKHLGKRGPDPVGCFLLSWFYHRQDQKEKAIDWAFKAKNLAPGSPFLKKIHYFFAHPDVFEAWNTHTEPPFLKQHSILSPSKYQAMQELELLIEKLASFEDRDIDKDTSPASSNQTVLPSSSDDVDNIASDTLAKIHASQGEFDRALDIYSKLKEVNRDKENYYERQIERIQEEKMKDKQ